eukprot:26819-Eustigmatos_ZCMA.PRE.1
MEIKNFSLPDKNFSMSNFLQVDKQGLSLDMIGAFQAHFKRYAVGPNDHATSGNLTIGTAHGGSYFNADAKSNSGNITISSGR